MKIYIRLVLFVVVYLIQFVPSAVSDQEPFNPIWKRMNSEAKQHFIAGYLHALKDARSILSITSEYLDQNPELVGASLKKIQRIYDVSDLTARPLVREMDHFYSKPENESASLSVGFSAARTNLSNIR